MGHTDGQPRAAFAVDISVLNKGSVPVEVKDILLLATDHKGGQCFYEPLLLWDMKQYIETEKKEDRIGKAQKGQAPLPILVPATKEFSFENHVLFLPIIHEEMIKPKESERVHVELYALTSHSKHYKKIASQVFDKNELAPLENGSFSGVRSSSSMEERRRFVHTKRT